MPIILIWPEQPEKALTKINKPNPDTFKSLTCGNFCIIFAPLFRKGILLFDTHYEIITIQIPITF